MAAHRLRLAFRLSFPLMKILGVPMKYAIVALTAVTLGTVALGLAFTTWATITTTTPTGERMVRTQEEFGNYVEQVFRSQNDATSHLINHYELSGYSESASSANLLAVEERMDQSCRYLIEIVSLRMEHREPSLALKKRLVDTITGCDYATRDVAQLIGSSGPVVVTELTALQ